MDRSARRARSRSRTRVETLAPSQRARRREAGIVVIDLDDDDGGAAAAAAASRRGPSAAPPLVPAGAVAMRTRSRRQAMQAAVVAEEAPRRKGTSAEAEGVGGSKRAAASKTALRGKLRKRSRRASEPADGALVRKGKQVEAEAEAEAPACGESVVVSRVDGRESSGRGDDASDGENGESHTGDAGGIDKGNEEHRSAAGGDRIDGHRGNGQVSVLNLNHVMNEVVSGDAEGVEGGENEGGNQDGDFDVDEERMDEEDKQDCGNRELVPFADVMTEEVATCEDDYDDELLEEKLVGDVIRAYSHGGDLDANGVDWEAEDEMEFDDDDFMDDADECGMSEPMHDDAKVAMQDLVDHKVVLGAVRYHEEEEVIKDEVEPKREGTLGFNQGSLLIEILDSDEEVKVFNHASNSTKRKPLVQAKTPIVPSCVAWRTRSSWGIKQDRFSYNTYFEALSDEPKEDDDDTEVDLDDDEEDDNDDNGNSGSYDEEEEEEQEEEEEAERRGQKKGIDSSDDEIIDDTVRYSLEWEEFEDPEVDLIRPLSFEKDGSEGPVGDDTITQQQKRSRFTWELERRKKLKLGLMKNRCLYERDLDSDSYSSGSGRNRRHGFQGGGDHKVGRKKKHLSSKSGKKSSRSTMLKRQSLLKLLMDKMCGNKDGESSPFDQNPWIEYNFKDLHPLVFSFGDEDPMPTDRPEQDATLDMLWADIDFALESENIGTYYDDEGHKESNLQGLALAPITPCSRGKHEFIIDEQIGIRCKYCSLVNLEIRFILPSLASNFAEKPAWQNASGLKNALMYHDLCEQAGSGDGQSQDFHLYGTVWDLIPGVVTTMYQHQHEAFEFMWTNLVGDIRLDELKHGAKPDVVGGCVICHAPGTGKTRLAIVFIQTYMKVFPDCRPVIIAPRGMLFAWEEEFKKWNVNVPFHIMNTADYSGKEDRDICRLIKKEHRTEKLTRLVKLLSWNKGHGILGISYGLYMKLTSEKSGCTEENKVRSILLENPGLLVLDEGHTPRNERSVIWKTLGKVKTEKRIILSGTPFQNNFLELYNILCLVRPRFGEMFLTKTRVGRRHHVSKKQRDKFSDKYEKGVWASLTSNVTDDNAEKVRSILKPFVHIHNGNILRTLPGLRECVIVLKPLPLQKSIIRKVENIGSGNNFEHEYVISLASTHPSLVTAINMSEEEASLIDKPMLEKLRSNPYEGVKTRFVIEVVRLCEALKEKVLIFSQFIQPLELIKEHLRKYFKWREGKEILQMDGKILPRYRQTSIEVFNNPDSGARVLLASTRACCEGISLTGASRVVLLDVVWNPAVGRQAISRAFRIGQKKFVYTYNLITYGTGEGDKYDRQAEKDHLSKLVFSTEDEFNNVRNMLSKAEMEHCSKLISEDKVLEEMTSHDQLKGMFLKIHYPPTESNIVYTYNQIAPELS